MDVVCTAGHVDHGKSTLVRALTGMEPDRFDEERRRGLTIDIGFGWTDLSASDRVRTVAFVDLPGHERFIANMLAGAGPVETALFVVAADEGWKPQSTEHLEILDLLGVRHGVVALTKADAADDTRLEQVRAATAAQIESTSLAGAPIVPVSAVDGRGLDDLRRALLDVLDAKPAPRAPGRPRLWVDRAFSVKGAGTVVTGTLTGGRLRTGDAVVVAPAGPASRVRGLQSLKASVDEALPGDRVAVNISGIDREAVERGDVLTTAGTVPAVLVADVEVRTLPGSAVGRRGAWHLHVGSGEWPARIRPLLGSSVAGTGFARVLLDRPAPLVVGDRFVLRDAGRRATVAGGVVLDVDPPAVRGAVQRATRVEDLSRRQTAVAAGDAAALFRLVVAERGAVSGECIAAALDMPPSDAPGLATAARVLPLAGGWADPRAAAQWTAAVTDALGSYHAANPDQRTAARDLAQRAATAAGCPDWAATDFVATLARVGRITTDGAGVRLPGHAVVLSPAQQRAKAALLAALAAEPFAPPRLSVAAADAGASASLIRELETAGELVRLGDDLVMTAAAVDQAAAVLRRQFAGARPFTASQAKEALGTTRKYAMPLLEELDRRAYTARNGDVRHVL